MLQSILKLLGMGSKTGQAPSLPNSPSESKTNSIKEQPVEKKGPKPKNPESAIENLVALALSQVGVKEVGGNNRGAKIREYQ